ncbi:MAG: hypothetical protein IT332_13570 [Ardenticatenales bacterium]|nr:hypothetical protein [Ardenticatenales bacterium]
MPSPLRARRLVLVVLAVVTASAAPQGALRARAQGLTPYVLVDQWPRDVGAPTPLIGDPQGLDVDADDRVFVSDRTAGGVVTLLPNGILLPPFGATGSGPERLASPGRLAIDQMRERLYVLDRGTDRVVAFDLEGVFQTAWSAAAVAIAVGPDGTVYAAGSAADEVTAFAADGSLRWRFGSTGTENGRFVHPVDVGVDAAGKVVAVSDLDGYRVQLFDLEAGGLKFRRSIDLDLQRYNEYRVRTAMPIYMRCHAGVVQPLGEDAVWVGDGTGACIIEADGWHYTIAAIAAATSICKYFVRLPRLRPATGQYAALATYNPNVGPCRKGGNVTYTKDTRLEASPAVVWYRDADLRQFESYTLVTNDLPPDRLLGPQRIDIPVPGVVFVQDDSAYSHAFGLDGSFKAATPKRDIWQNGRPARTWIDLAAGSPVDGEAFGYYRREIRTSFGAGQPWFYSEREHGIDRYRGTPQRIHERSVDVIESVWPDPRPWSLDSPESVEQNNPQGNKGYLTTVDLAYNRTIDELDILVSEQATSGVDEEPRIAAMRSDGTGRLRNWTLAGFAIGSAQINPYVDLDVGPDGRIYALDDLSDLVVTLDHDGAPGAVVAVSADAKAVAGGPDGTLFTLGDSGYVERRNLTDSMLTARFDGRPLPGADPITLTSLEVDDAGQVYVADRLSSIVSVFAPGDASDAVPSDASCKVHAAKTAAPSRIVLGGSADVVFTLGGTCGTGEPPTDVVLVVAGLGRDMSESREAIRAARVGTMKYLHHVLDQVARLDLGRHRVGLVKILPIAAPKLPLTHDRDDLMSAIRRLDSDRHAGYPRSDMFAALKQAGKLFDHADGRRHVILFVDGGGCYEEDAAKCEEAAAELDAAGVRLVIAPPSRRPDTWVGGSSSGYMLASSSDDIIPYGQSAYSRLVQTIIPAALGTNLVLTDTLPSNMVLVPGSPQPAGAAVAGDDIAWSQPELPFGPTVFRLQVRPQQVGHWPTNARAVARFTDAWGKPQEVVFPIPEIDVIAGPSPTPQPTATARATDEPTPVAPTTPASDGTPGGVTVGRVYLPIARCER